MISASEFMLNYVVNASWQTVAVVLVAALGSYLLRNAPARYRHVLWLAALASCLLVPLLTATHRPSPYEAISITPPPATNANPQSDLSVAHLTKPRTRVVNTTSHTAQWLILTYSLFVAWRAITLVRFWRRKERLRRSATVAGLPPQVEQAAQRCRTIFRLTNVSITQSSVARMPYTLGARRPLIVLPEAFCTASDDCLLSVIGHEMAHVARRDYLSNFICELAALPISFHPLTFLIKRQIDRARELACDELVSKQLLPPKLYARSLVWAADVSSQSHSALVLSMFDGRSLEERVMRLTRRKKMLSRALARAIMSVTLFALCAATISLSLFSLELQTQARAVFIPAATPRNEDAGAAIVTRETVGARQSRAERSLNASGAQKRAEAACDAGHASDVEKIPALIAMLADDTKTTLIRCWNIGRWSPALETFKHPSPGEEAAIALASLGRPAFIPLASQLDSGNSTVRRNAAWAIGELTNMPPGERDDAVPRLVTLLSDSDEWVRMAAARALGELRNQTAVPKLIATLSDSDGRVRELAVWALSELKDDRAVAALCSVLLSDVRVEVRRGAAEALGEIRSAEALPSLKQALNDPDVRPRAQWAISEIEDSGD